MGKHIVKELSPEEQELEKKREELSKLKSGLAEKELELLTLSKELEAFTVRYLQVVGIRLAKLDEIEAQIAAYLASQLPSDKGAQEVANIAREKARESKEASEFAKKQKFPASRIKPTEDLKNLYREIAKQIHPDLAESEEQQSKREELMKLANEAFNEGDKQKLRSILAEWQASPEQVTGEGIGVELVRVIRQISLVENRITAIQNEISEMKSSDYYVLMEEVKSAQVSGNDLLSKMASELDRQISKKKLYLEEITQ